MQMADWLAGSHLSGGQVPWVEDLYERYLVDPASVPDDWRATFDALPGANGPDPSHARIRKRFEGLATTVTPGNLDPAQILRQTRVTELIAGYRHRGHTKANLDPLKRIHNPDSGHLNLDFYDLDETDLSSMFHVGKTYFGFADDRASLGQILDALEQTYCGNIGFEITHITSAEHRGWLLRRIENNRGQPGFDAATKRHILGRLTAAEGLEHHLDGKYPGTKRFGLEGNETLIPLMDALIQHSGNYGVQEIAMGMAHRGRLNILVNVLGKNPRELFDEFDGLQIHGTSGDVKYHQGFSSSVRTSGGEVHLALSFNPSHLEIVAPVVEGSVRARQDRRGDAEGDQVVPIVLHGDAAFAGQGVVMETFQMSQTRGFKTGGTIHVIVNNQIGFTTSERADGRSTEYSTEVAKMVQAPIFHVNADDPEAAVHIAQLAVDYRYTFKRDVVIDLIGYRRRGHNETDEPSATQPLMYQAIRRHPTARTLYAERLIEEGLLSLAQAAELSEAYRDALESGEPVAHALITDSDRSMYVDWSPYLDHRWTAAADTAVPMKTLQRTATALASVPDGFRLHPQVARVYEGRQKMSRGELPLDWGTAEALALGTLLEQGYPVRMSGQDIRRGTFSQRHAVACDQNTGAEWCALGELSGGRADLYDSLLSEEAVLAFEYGYASTMPTGLVIWEAQFGDFANGAQVVVDQFITSAEHKWSRLCGLVMLLPHGNEGQGPEHSSARLERYLQLCAQHNIQICVPSTAAQIFHLLRRQVLRKMRRPLIVMAPKWLLRHKLASASLDELANGRYLNVIGEQKLRASTVRRLVLCSGKVYYHLLEEREKRNLKDTALVRIEQLYPFPEDELTAVLQSFKTLDEVFWCQEEPMNQGAWYSSQHHLRRVLHNCHPPALLQYAGREPMSAPSGGYMQGHLLEQQTLVAQALGLKPDNAA